MENSYTVPPDGMETRELYKSKNQYLYNVLQNCVKGGQGLIYIRKHELTLDGRKNTDCNTELSKMRPNWNYKGGPLKFFLAFQN
eukprot:8029681-Ditylum_brightwellii.AAC.1